MKITMAGSEEDFKNQLLEKVVQMANERNGSAEKTFSILFTVGENNDIGIECVPVCVDVGGIRVCGCF